MSRLTATCVWRTTAGLLVAIDRALGEPTDSYVNGSQTWLRPDGPSDVMLEWRLHPVAGYVLPGHLDVHDVFAAVAFALANGTEPPAPLDTLWDGLEVFPAHGDEVEPAPLAAIATERLGVTPTAVGLVDHDDIADKWEAARGQLSIVDALVAQLDAAPED